MNSKEQMKEQIEQECLDTFLPFYHEFDGARAIKQEQPDYVLDTLKGKHIGIEITRFTTESQEVIKRITAENHGSSEDAETLKNNAVKEHGKKAAKYGYYRVEETFAISTGIMDSRQNRRYYAELVNKKYNIYEKQMDRFDTFIILCDARFCPDINCEEEAQEVVETAKKQYPSKPFDIAILYEEEHGTCCYRQNVLP